jgi:hypothetical protein
MTGEAATAERREFSAGSCMPLQGDASPRRPYRVSSVAAVGGRCAGPPLLPQRATLGSAAARVRASSGGREASAGLGRALAEPAAATGCRSKRGGGSRRREPTEPALER